MNPDDSSMFSAGQSCPVPVENRGVISMAHGGGGKLMHRLIESVFGESWRQIGLDTAHDSARVETSPDGPAIAFTTDSFVVQPLFFPGGDIGKLAVFGTVNDLAMRGARPIALSAAFVIEAGLRIDTVARVADSMRDAAIMAGVKIVTGDTKVIDHRGGGNLIVTTAGIGVFDFPHAVQTLGPAAISAGDVVIVSGDVGRHGMAIMAVREGLEFESAIESDAAPLAKLVADLLAERVAVRALRDCTRGGLATALIEFARSSGRRIVLDESAIPIRGDVRAAADLLGLDPLYIANEGRLTAIVAAADADRACDILRRHPVAESASIIGTVTDLPPHPPLALRYSFGTERALDWLTGDQLPRIC